MMSDTAMIPTMTGTGHTCSHAVTLLPSPVGIAEVAMAVAPGLWLLLAALALDNAVACVLVCCGAACGAMCGSLRGVSRSIAAVVAVFLCAGTVELCWDDGDDVGMIALVSICDDAGVVPVVPVVPGVPVV